MMKRGEEYIGSFEQRAVDSVLATILLTGLALPFSGAALAMAIQQRSLNVLLRQQRVKSGYGQDGMNFFDIWKLRTIEGQDYGGLFEPGGCMHPRASKLGQFIRFSGIDEAPQLLNVVQGNLNLFGIRPQTEATLEQRQSANSLLFEEWYHWYEKNQGMIGLGQIAAHQLGAYEETSPDVAKIMEADIHQSEHSSTVYNLRLLGSLPVGLVRTMIGRPVEITSPNEAA